MTDTHNTLRFLLCPPRHFAVAYAINPWMQPDAWARHKHRLTAAAHEEWQRLDRTLRELGAHITYMPAVPGLPDLVFTANAAVVLDGKALLSRFRYPERQGEEPHVEAAFRELHARGLIDAIRKLPEGLVLEGAGDCVWDEARQHFWMGYGPRSDAAAAGVVQNMFGVMCVALELADPRFYHLDTALSPLPGGEVLYVPGAFTPAARARIRDIVPPDRRIEIDREDAHRLAANSVCVGDRIVMAPCSERLCSELHARGYRLLATPLHAFRRSGGGAYCLTLRLDRRTMATRAAIGGTAA